MPRLAWLRRLLDEPHHGQMSKRAMAADIVRLMEGLGHGRFAVVGHDRGAYVALRAALDHPDRVSHLVALDAVPIGEALARADARFAQAWWHWFFFAQPAKPERAILADPDAWYGGDPGAMGIENHADRQRAIHDPATVHAMLEDYRAGLTVDRTTTWPRSAPRSWQASSQPSCEADGQRRQVS